MVMYNVCNVLYYLQQMYSITLHVNELFCILYYRMCTKQIQVTWQVLTNVAL